MNEDVVMRQLKPTDGLELASLIKSVLQEYDGDWPREHYAELHLDKLYHHFNAPQSAYWVIETSHKLAGGMGYAPLFGGKEDYCELQRAFLRSEYRGKGWGKALLHKCLKSAKKDGFRFAYLETTSYMREALTLFRGFGFSNLDGPIGTTEHRGIDVWMVRKL